MADLNEKIAAVIVEALKDHGIDYGNVKGGLAYAEDILAIPEIRDAAECRALLEESQYLFAHGVGAMTDNGDKDNQERNIREAGELMLRISKKLAA